ncbi:TylF/MycF/NovP-related O-methyltransferase [Methylobrevis pamukkalensis]|nr:TylF/MycF/NovP-related O-methyltransferase [Methylobrevis pamukkalensis]
MASIPAYLARHPELRIALLHLDMDVEAPTAFALEALWDRVVPGGLVVVDDYNAVAGATDAFDAFCAARGIGKVEKTPFYSVPAFVVKPGP